MSTGIDTSIARAEKEKVTYYPVFCHSAFLDNAA